MNIPEKEINIDICLLPSSCDPWLLQGFCFADRSYKVFPAHSRTYIFNLSEGGKRKVWFFFKKIHNFLQPRMRGKACTHSSTTFPFSHEPVQVACSPQSVIFTVVTDGRKADCNYSNRYWGHPEVVSLWWKTEALLSHKGQVFITFSCGREPSE